MPTVLLIEDEIAIAETLLYALRTEGFATHHTLTGQEGLRWLRENKADFLVLDIGLPDMLGFDLCRELRTFSHIPVLFLTARSSEIDQVLGLELGADDYVTKPFSPRAVVARVRAILRRLASAETPSAPAQVPFLHHEKEAMSIHCQGQALPLTAHEYKLLALLLGQPGRTFTRDQLLMQAWDDPGSAMDRTIDAHIKSLRAKIRQAAPGHDDPIQTRRGLGYCLQL
ncbi:two-component system response regulator CreB [Roseibacillus ishigakijimensis]|uniref:Two-component system response regulator CreB n=1 Tax=Roseibacillus ishigakijimensis TaxID=454146 RepID=A0A934VHQ0_9BACT|nr:two-component system response regulator CreB [Roseibacillus ishigakijimensis]MBK1834213.1 two-component system response regulator CreB [Roseibacillus ishigakijimensis]